MENGDVQLRFQAALNLKAAGGSDVLQVDAAKGGGQVFDGLDDFLGVLGIQADGEGIHIAKGLEQHGLALHDRHGGLRPDVAQAQHGGAVAHHGHGAALDGVLIGIVLVGVDAAAGLGHAGGIGHA